LCQVFDGAHLFVQVFIHLTKILPNRRTAREFCQYGARGFSVTLYIISHYI
jgi:hypothetical protein